MSRKILTANQEILLNVERHWLTNLQIALARFSAAQDDRDALENSIRQLDELFLLVVVGEFNSGKSSFLNALFGQKLLEEGVTPTTSRIHLLKHGEVFERVAVDSFVDVFTAPAEILREIDIVDTPGTNAIQREHEAITEEFIPRSDLVLFVTSVDRPFTESERAFLERIREWGKKVVVVLNKLDILDKTEDLERIKAFISENSRNLLGFTPEIFPISARLAFKARETGDAELLKQSNIESLEDYIMNTLDAQERIRLKLSNPMGVGTHLIAKYSGVIDERLTLLQDDFAVTEDIERQLATYQEDTTREFRFRLADIDKILAEFENRGVAYFDETIRLLRMLDLINKEKIKAEFARDVIADVPDIINARVNDLIDWLVARNLDQWQAVMEHISTRRHKHAERLIGQTGRAFEYDRAHLIDSVSRTAQRALETYDETRESRRITESLQTAVWEVAAVELAAVATGVGTTIVLASSLDPFGVLFASAVAIVGFLIIPAQKRKVKKELHTKISIMRMQLVQTLTLQFDRELRRAMDEIGDAIAPYTRFIRSERKYLEETKGEFLKIRQWLERQLAEVESL